MAEKKTMQRRAADVRALLQRPDVKQQLAMALPKHVTVDRLIRVALTSVQRTPKLLEADQTSLLAALFQAAQLGLEPDGALGQAYLIPYGQTVQFQPGYRGLLALVRRSGELSTVEVRAVHAKDEFRFRYGLNSVLEHDPAEPRDPDDLEFDPGPLVAVYAIARLKDSGIQWEVMRRHEIEAIRKRSKAANDGPWVTHYDEMAKKTVLKRLCKLLPMSVEAMTAIDLDDKAEVGLPQDLEVPPGVADGPEAPGTTTKLDALTATLTGGRASEAPAAPVGDLLAEGEK